MHAASTSLLRRSHSARMEPWDVQAPRSPLAAVRRVIESATPHPHRRCNVHPRNRQATVQVSTSRMDHPLLYPRVIIVKAHSFVFAEYLRTEAQQTLAQARQPLRPPTFLPC